MIAPWRRLFSPVDGSSLAFFRIAFGIMMFAEVFRYFVSGWIGNYFIEPRFHFRYHFFQWVHPWPGFGMYIHWAALGLLSVFITFGIFYRLSAALFALGFTYIFLLEQSNYLNHFYMIILVSFIMIFVPAHKVYSVHARRAGNQTSPLVPVWSLYWLRFQLGIVYFFGGVAKINSDWLQGEPMRTWLRGYADFWLIGPYVHEEWMVSGFTYGGLLFDLLVVPALLWRRTRWLALILALMFHLTNALLFNIGVFPPLMAAATLIFFSPDWPRRLLGRLSMPWLSKPKPLERANGQFRGFAPSKSIALCLGVYAVFQLIIPLRHWLYPGNVSWTEEGHNFSWHMKLRDKRATIVFYAVDPVSKKTRVIDAADYLSDRQRRKMVGRPDMVMRFSHFLADELSTEIPRVEIYVNSKVSLNGRRYVPMIDPEVDMSKVEPTLKTKAWIIPLKEPLRERSESSKRSR